MAGENDRKRGTSPLKNIFAKKANTQKEQKIQLDRDDQTELLRTLLDGQKSMQEEITLMRGDLITMKTKWAEFGDKQGKLKLVCSLLTKRF